MATLASFSACVEHVDGNPYWEEIFKSAAQNSFPPCYSFRDGTLTYRTKRKTVTLACPDDPEALTVLVQTFFKQTSGLMSDEDRNSYWTKQGVSDVANKWTQVKTQSQRKLMIEKYIKARTLEHALTPVEQRQLKQTIALGMCLQAFPKININNGCILEIEGLLFNTTTRVFYYNKPTTKDRKPVSVDVAVGEEHNSDVAAWVRAWLRFLRLVGSHVDNAPSSTATDLPTPLFAT